VILTQHRREDALAYCRDYELRITRKCIADELAKHLKATISADCSRGIFSNFTGDRLQMKGLNPKTDDVGPKYILVNLGTGEVADGSEASGYPINMGIFQALCPKTAPSDP
jgi:hypothetical protein